jgi:hypothetical protein
MTPVSLLRVFLTAFMLQCFILAGSGWWMDNAHAGTPDKSGNNAEIYSISITPGSVPVGSHPRIRGFVRNTSSSANGKDGKAVFDVTAVITSADGSRKSLSWKNVSFSARQDKAYEYGNKYDVNQAGTYKVEFSIYNSERTHLYSSRSKSFIVTRPSAPAKPVQPSEKAKTTPESATGPGKEPLQTTTPQIKLLKYEREAVMEIGGKRKFIGLGAHINTLNFSGGPSLILWPLKNLAIQGTYGFGTFTSYEARTFYRFPLTQRVNPYLGAGYINTERKGTVIGVDTKIKGESYTVFGGVELPLYKNLYGYVDVSGTPIKLKKEVVNGTTQATATVKYNPVTVCIGLVLYLF